MVPTTARDADYPYSQAASRHRRWVPRRSCAFGGERQEDLCQATGRPPTGKYESEGGPSIRESLDLLAASEDAISDQSNFVLAQLAFWLLAAPDGHGKNFSLAQLAGGAFRMTPLYDVISAWPIIGHGKNQLPIEKAKLATAVRSKNAHYRIDEITARHWRTLADETGIPGLWERMQAFVDAAAIAISQLAQHLPGSFPPRVYDAIEHGVHAQARKFRNARAQK
jgi:serine/threonine-protein kinase HipA